MEAIQAEIEHFRSHKMKFTVEVERRDLMDWAEDMKPERIAGMLRNCLEKGGFCYSAKVEVVEQRTLRGDR